MAVKQREDVRLAAAPTNHQLVEVVRCEAPNESELELLEGGEPVSGGLIPNGTLLSSFTIASGSGRPARTIEQSLDLLGSNVSQLTGHMNRIQEQVAGFQQVKANNSWANLETYVAQVVIGINTIVSL